MLDLARPAHDGVVIVAFGSGNVPPGAVPAIAPLARRGEAGGARQPLPLGRGLAGLRLRRRRRPHWSRWARSRRARGRRPQARMELMIALSAGVAYGA